MTLVRVNPLFDLDREVDSIGRMMNRALQNWGLGGHPEMRWSFAPALEVEETPEAIILKAELPGIDPADLDIEVTADRLTLKGERKSETRREEDGMFRSEFSYGRFERSVSLPATVKHTDASVAYRDGILAVTIPKLEEDTRRVTKLHLNDQACGVTS